MQGAGRRAKQRGERVLERTLDARQFALKMISNVTYGYTAAGFSGHMPMAELADAIVECGRATLENAIRYYFNGLNLYFNTLQLLVQRTNMISTSCSRSVVAVAALTSKLSYFEYL